MVRRKSTWQSGSITLTCLTVYAGFAIATVIAAHIFQIARPGSGWGARLIAPLATGLEFLDMHWKSALVLLVPFAAPFAHDLPTRLREVGPIKFDPVPLGSVAAKEKPNVTERGDD